ncbi:hypothetical protein BCL69_10235 [Nitrosomonas communis]|uniref:Uncharacterized protein n=1 Tax=Nitrosomonas communis TaxID=44574 RepID=A0A0F7KG78_9PROT|nr:hypothetical protein AAW31_12685 [Nitrosomonas communis]TYP87773.1 hypothetical protein BCL69_10235 [Nitrosomonas communis]
MILERINTVKHTIMKVFLPQLILKMSLWIRSGEYRAGIINGGFRQMEILAFMLTSAMKDQNDIIIRITTDKSNGWPSH